VQCYRSIKRDKVTTVADFKHKCVFESTLEQCATPSSVPEVPDPRHDISQLQTALLDFMGATGDLSCPPISTRVQTWR
jgi:hypothetical protein